MDRPLFSILVWTIGTNLDYYREFLSSIVEQDYDNFQLIVLDDNAVSELETITKEFLPENDKVIYRKLKKHNSRAYALNIGLHFATGDYIVLGGQHDTFSPIALSKLAEKIEEDDSEIIYSDHDELIAGNRMNPHFKSDFNKGLFLQTNYIGEFICFKKSIITKAGKFDEKWQSADIYEYIVRAMEVGFKINHIPVLLFHRRMIEVPSNSSYRKIMEQAYNEHRAVSKEYFRRQGLKVNILSDPGLRYWRTEFDGSDYKLKKKEYIVLRNKSVKVHSPKKAMAKMYGQLKQKDVAVVGCKFMQSTFTVANAGYIYDTNGITYPACYREKSYQDGYDYRQLLSQDVSLVDFGFCLLDENVYRHLHGFNTELTGMDMFLDYCLRVEKAGYRVVYESSVVARDKEPDQVSSEVSNARLIDIWSERLEIGDSYYNENLPMGMDNYSL